MCWKGIAAAAHTCNRRHQQSLRQDINAGDYATNATTACPRSDAGAAGFKHENVVHVKPRSQNGTDTPETSTQGGEASILQQPMELRVHTGDCMLSEVRTCINVASWVTYAVADVTWCASSSNTRRCS